MAMTPSGPDVPPPLTERERRILAAIGEGLAAESPKLGRQLSAPVSGLRRRGPADHVVCVVVVLVVLAMVLPSAWFVVAVVMVMIVAPPLLAARSLAEGDGGVDAGTDQP
jgi:hypothetical protein